MVYLMDGYTNWIPVQEYTPYLSLVCIDYV